MKEINTNIQCLNVFVMEEGEKLKDRMLEEETKNVRDAINHVYGKKQIHEKKLNRFALKFLYLRHY